MIVSFRTAYSSPLLTRRSPLRMLRTQTAFWVSGTHAYFTETAWVPKLTTKPLRCSRKPCEVGRELKPRGTAFQVGAMAAPRTASPTVVIAASKKDSLDFRLSSVIFFVGRDQTKCLIRLLYLLCKVGVVCFIKNVYAQWKKKLRLHLGGVASTICMCFWLQCRNAFLKHLSLTSVKVSANL